MCFSFEVSLGTFIFSWTTSLFLLYKNIPQNVINKKFIYFLMIFSTMQLWDAILWFIKMKKNAINYFVTSVLIPIILSMLILYNLYFINNYTNIFTHLFTLFAVIYIFNRFNGYTKCLCKNKFDSPIWGGKELTLFELILFNVLISFPRVDYIIFGSLFLYVLNKFYNSGYGSMWCSVANIFAFVFIFKYINYKYFL